MEDEYDHDKVSEGFKQLADLAGALYRTKIDIATHDPGAAVMHDELLARLCVYGYLYDRHFLQTRELLVAELRWLLATNRPNTPRTAINARVYDSHRSALLKMLIARFQRPGADDDAMRPVNPRISAELRLTGVSQPRPPR
jgi:hypothetical protein